MVIAAGWRSFEQMSPHLTSYRSSGPTAHLHLDLITGDYQPDLMEPGGAPGYFEIEIGNQVCYSAPMGEAGPFFRELQQRWLPYYPDERRQERLTMTKDYCAYDLQRIPAALSRGLCFHAFDRLTVAFQKYLQALFISRRTYPIAYNKWIKMQVESWLGMPALYRELLPILSIKDLESSEMAVNAGILMDLLNDL
jgi:hypothetical protein